MALIRSLLKFNPVTNARTASISIRNRNYPVTITGTGAIPCLSTGIGTLMQRTLSDEFRKTFTLYSTDTYWTKDGAITNPTALTIDSLVEDNLSIAKQLGLKDYVLMGNSCFGITAMETARKAKTSDPNLRGVLAVAAAPCWNDAMIKETNDYFLANADQKRIENHKARRAHFESIRKPNESEVSLNGYEADSAKYWYDYHITRGELEVLWAGIEGDDPMMNHFFGTLLPNFDLGKNIHEVDVPVVVAGGEVDYDSLPFVLWPKFNKPKNFEMINCGNTGHWPHFENMPLFDKEVAAWATKHIVKKQQNVDSKHSTAAASSSYKNSGNAPLWQKAPAVASKSAISTANPTGTTHTVGFNNK